MPSTEWSQRERKQPWYPGETISVAIGQGAVSVTPMSLATMIATVANGGTLVTPHLVKAVDEDGGWKPIPTPAPKSQIRHQSRDASGGSRRALDGRERRTARAAGRKIEGKDVSGKTGHGAGHLARAAGRAAAGRTDKDLRDHGWFVFFAPRDNPQIAGVVFAEHGGHGVGRRADRQVRDGDVLRQAGRAAAARLAAADRRRARRRRPDPARATGRPGTGRAAARVEPRAPVTDARPGPR